MIAFFTELPGLVYHHGGPLLCCLVGVVALGSLSILATALNTKDRQARELWRRK